jgi:hypothetical protein
MTELVADGVTITVDVVTEAALVVEGDAEEVDAVVATTI